MIAASVISSQKHMIRACGRFSIRITSLQDGYLMSGEFVGSSHTPVVFGYQLELARQK
jgi:hypothetical protein